MRHEMLSGGMFAAFGLLVGMAVIVGMAPVEATASVQPRAVVRENRIADLSVADRNCLVQTALGEATAHSKVEAIAIMRNILKRRQMGRWGRTVCQVVKAKAQYSCWSGRKIPGRSKSAIYRKYDGWASIAIARGPSQYTHYIHPVTLAKLYGKSRPGWWKSCRATSKVGAALFCTMKG